MNVYIDGKVYEAKEGETILDVARANGIDIPTLCYMKGFNPSSNCRICLVKVDGQKNFITACSFKVQEGMKIDTKSKEVILARKTNLELMLSNHNYDCDNCSRDGECALQYLTQKYEADPKRFNGEKTETVLDCSSPAIIRDNSKCILCRKCVEVCSKKQSVNAITSTERGFRTKVSTAFNSGLDDSSCVACGQCVLVCPTGALTENFQIKEVEEVLSDKSKHVVVAPAPSVRVALGDEFGLNVGENIEGILPSVLRSLGFSKVFDINFAADLTIMEEAKELVERLEKNKNLPLFTSCCPAWVDFVRKFYPQFKDNVSSTKSPQEMFGAVVKSYYADKQGINPNDIVVVSIMPCTAKKKELTLGHNGKLRDVDYSLTVRELAYLIKKKKIDIKRIKPSSFDELLGTSTGAGVIFGASGGVMEAALRTAVDSLSGKIVDEIDYTSVRGLKGVKLASVYVGEKEIKVAAVSGLSNARELLKKLESGEIKLDFVEVMSCAGGCVNGGGMPRKGFEVNDEILSRRAKSLYAIDKNRKIRKSHENPQIKEFYQWQSAAKNKAHLHTR